MGINSAMESTKFYHGRWQNKYFHLEAGKWEEGNQGRLFVGHGI